MEHPKAIIGDVSVQPEQDKSRYLELLGIQFTRLRELGFVGPDAVALLTQNESSLQALDLNTLKAIAQGAQFLLKCEDFNTTRNETEP